MCSTPRAFKESKKRKYLLLHSSDWFDGAANEMPGIVVGRERWAEPERYPCVAVEVTISGITRFDFVYPDDFPSGEKGETMERKGFFNMERRGYKDADRGTRIDLYLKVDRGGIRRLCTRDGVELAGMSCCRYDYVGEGFHGIRTVTPTFELCGWIDAAGRVRTDGDPFTSYCPHCGEKLPGITTGGPGDPVPSTFSGCSKGKEDLCDD